MKRSETASSAAAAIAAIACPHKAVVGFDGFIDSIIHMVDTRHDMKPDGYTRLRTITAFAARCGAAAGKSTNIEQVLIEDRFGGNGPLMASAVAQLGMGVTYIGAVGSAGDGNEGKLHPVFAEFAKRCAAVLPVCGPSHTDALEFDDGKLMFNNTRAVQDVTWERIVERVGLERLRAIVEESRLLGIVNWSLQGGVPGIWRGLIGDVFAKVAAADRRVFIDLSDPAKRTDEDIAEGMGKLRELEEAPNVSVTLGLNLSEAERIAGVLGVSAFAEKNMSNTSHTSHTSHMSRAGSVLRAGAEAIRAALDLSCVVIHPREGAAAANGDGESAWFDGPFTNRPKLSTGAGDHFNGGFGFAQVHGLGLAECLAVGCAVSGAYVRDAQSPTRARLVEFLSDLPEPE